MNGATQLESFIGHNLETTKTTKAADEMKTVLSVTILGELQKHVLESKIRHQFLSLQF